MYYSGPYGTVDESTLPFQGYCGKGSCKDNPAAESVVNEGPIPVGWYTIQAPVDTDEHGPYVLWLTPDPTNVMYGRSGFGIHGDSIDDPGSASEGCIILDRNEREAIWGSGDNRLEVVSGQVPNS